jgi:hypothetical protein
VCLQERLIVQRLLSDEWFVLLLVLLPIPVCPAAAAFAAAAAIGHPEHHLQPRQLHRAHRC